MKKQQLWLTCLTVHTTGRSRSAESELCRAEPLVWAGAAGRGAAAVAPADGVTGALAERRAQVAPARQERAEVVERNFFLWTPKNNLIWRNHLHCIRSD